MASGRAVGVGGILVVGLLAAGGYAAVRTGFGPFSDPQACTVTAGDHTVTLSIDQAQNASIIAAVAERRGLPARAVSIALATAYQESKLENLDGGDRDSRGLFQQRPSQGWGTPEQVTDPYYAANAFYDALEQVEGYRTLPITEAAQLVQRSAYPDAYRDHEADGRAVASALTGYSESALSCVVDSPDADPQRLRADGLTGRADAVRRDLRTAFGELPLGGFAPGGVSTGHMEGSAHYEGRAIDIFFRPVNPDNRRRGWVVAHYLVANSARLKIDHVIFDAWIWTAGDRSAEGWREFTPRNLTGDEDPATLSTLEHRDHVHVDVV
jgi:hypothetical protein